MRVDSWPEPQSKRLPTQPYEKPTREPTCEPNAATVVKSVMDQGHTRVVSHERRTPNSRIAPANVVYHKVPHPGPSPVAQLPSLPGVVSAAAQLPAARQDPRWYNPHPCMPGVTSCSSALAAPAHAAAGCLTLPAQAVEWQRPSWPVAPALALPLAGGPARGSVVQPVTQLVTQPITAWAMQHDDSRGEEQNRKRTSSTNHLIGARSHSNQLG